jgi:hypothetical protein
MHHHLKSSFDPNSIYFLAGSYRSRMDFGGSQSKPVETSRSQSKPALDQEYIVERLPISLLSDEGIHAFLWVWEQSGMMTQNEQLVFLRIFAKTKYY